MCVLYKKGGGGEGSAGYSRGMELWSKSASGFIMVRSLYHTARRFWGAKLL